MSVGGAGEGGPLHSGATAGSGVPEDYLPRVRPSYHIAGVEPAEAGLHHRALGGRGRSPDDHVMTM